MATPRQGAADLDLLRAVFAHATGAWARFVQASQTDVYTACRLACSEAEANDAFREVMERLHADDFARLRAFDGRAPLSAYLRLVLRDLLCDRVAQQLAANPARGWRAFEHFFKRDIDRVIARRFPDAVDSGRHEDVYHDLAAHLIEDDYRRIRVYDGQGSFGGFVLRIVNNLCIDLMRKEMPRRRLPAAIKRLPDFEQEVFRQLYWENCPPERLVAALQAKAIAHGGADAVKAAAARVQAALPKNFHAGDGDDGRPKLVRTADVEETYAELPDDRPTPEAGAIAREEEETLEQATDALRAAVATMDPEIRLYLQHVMADDPPRPAREIARLMGRPVGEVYRLRQQAERQLRQALAGNAAVKNLRMSV